MSDINHFVPHHINASVEDLAGNNGIGRYILLPGSDGRAQDISRHFDNLTVKSHPRGHNLYLGSITHEGKKIDIASIASGMGCPSMEIILHELFQLGGKRFLRVGTAGSLQSDLVKLGSIVNAQASVRDEHTTTDYVPITAPAVASFEFILAISLAAKKLIEPRLHTGTVHCKSSFYAREFGAGPKSGENKAYIDLLKQCGILATEMETSALFIQSQLYNYQLMQAGQGPRFRVLSGAVLGVTAIPPHQFASSDQEKETIKSLTKIALETIKVISTME